MPRPAANRNRVIPGVILGGLCLSLGVGGFADAPPAGRLAWRESVREFAQEHFTHPAWGYSHSMRDYELARQLAASDHVSLDDDVLFAAAYLHDMAAFAPWAKPKVDHADEAASIVGTVLTERGFPMQKLAAVQGAIRTHMYDRDPVGAEALYLHDADALDWLGAIGVARILALADRNGGKPTPVDVMPMLEENLSKVPARVLSPAGQALVAPRRAELKQFLDDLRRESDDLHTL
jgi:HD superfamily phosphodiesterase